MISNASTDREGILIPLIHIVSSPLIVVYEKNWLESDRGANIQSNRVIPISEYSMRMTDDEVIAQD